MATCKVEVEVAIDRNPVKTRVWPAVDIMDTSRTRAWATRQFNAFLKNFNECDICKDKTVSVRWTASYGEAQGFGTARGRLTGRNGKVLIRDGVFED